MPKSIGLQWKPRVDVMVTTSAIILLFFINMGETSHRHLDEVGANIASSELYDEAITPNISVLETDMESYVNDSFPFYFPRHINITFLYPIEYAQPLLGYSMPFLLVITIVANTLIVVVLSKKHMRSPTNLVLMAMALSDMFTLLIPAPWLFYSYTLGNHYKPLYPVGACYAFCYMFEVIPALFHTASIWLTLALAVQRYIYICHAHLATTYITLPRVKKGIIWIYFLATLHQSTRFFDREISSMAVPWENGTAMVCYEHMAPWVQAIHIDVYFNLYFWFRVIFVHLIPCTALIVLNVLLFKALRAANKKRKKMFKDKPKSDCKNQRDKNCTTLMLIVVVTVFLLVEIPLAVITLLHIITSTFIQVLDYNIASILILFTNFFIMVSYPINFAIYCGMSKQFRKTFKELFIQENTMVHREGSSRYSLVNGPRTCTNETVL